MMNSLVRIFVTIVFLHLCNMYVKAQSEMKDPKGDEPGVLKFTPPNLSNDEAHSPWMPNKVLRCDGCHVVAHQLYTALTRKMQQMSSLKGDLPESEILDIFENVCGQSFESIGIKTIDGKNRIWGPGVKIFKENHPGIIAGGGKWPSRLKNICNDFVDKMGEMEIFSYFRMAGSTYESLEKLLCLGDRPENNFCTEETLGEDWKVIHGDESPDPTAKLEL